METALKRLNDVIHSLLGPDGCPWDQKQTPESLCDYVIEESFELVEAIRSGDAQESCEELGDCLFLLLFIAQLYTCKEEFTLADALNASADKMIRRHPHVFGDVHFENQEQLLKNWERIKRTEKHGEEHKEQKRVFESLPKGLPPMLRAYRVHSKAARIGFTWENDMDLEKQLLDEWREWQEALVTGDPQDSEEEFGDYLFTLIELGRRKGIKANAALHMAVAKFLTRFERMEDLAKEQNLDLTKLPLAEQNKLWDQAKAEEK